MSSLRLSLLRISFLFASMLLSRSSDAQNEYANWFIFGADTSQSYMSLLHDTISYHTAPVSMYTTDKPIVISDSSGTLLFSSDYFMIYDRYDTIPGSNLKQADGIHFFQTDFSYYPEDMLALKMDTAGNHYFLFHTFVDTGTIQLSGVPTLAGVCRQFYLTRLSFDPVTKRGHVDTLNMPIFNHPMAYEGMQAYQHANGKDWWVILREKCSNTFFKLLIGVNGLERVDSQSIGNVENFWDFNTAKFSSKGNYYATTDGGLDSHDGLDEIRRERRIEVFHFDRCTGLFSSFHNIYVPTTVVAAGVECANFEFSPDERFLYVVYRNFYSGSEHERLVQLDLDGDTSCFSAPLLFSYDTNTLTGPLMWMEIGNDSKIYVSGNGRISYFARIENPDSAGVACNFQYYAVRFPTTSVPYGNTTHNTHTYYNVGALPCDTNAIDELQARNEEGISISPNPASSKIIINTANWKAAFYFSLYDIQGNLIHNNSVARNNQEITLSSSLASGMYFWKASRSGQILANGKLLKE